MINWNLNIVKKNEKEVNELEAKKLLDKDFSRLKSQVKVAYSKDRTITHQGKQMVKFAFEKKTRWSAIGCW